MLQRLPLVDETVHHPQRQKERSRQYDHRADLAEHRPMARETTWTRRRIFHARSPE
jgi:hypothetical protein